jgi:hypothetical protein
MKAKRPAPAKIADMSPITQKIDALLRAEGFSNTSNSRIVGGNVIIWLMIWDTHGTTPSVFL